MMVNGKQYSFDKRTAEENAKFIGLLTAAEDKLSQALSEITYKSFPKVNNRTICDLQDIIGKISRIDYEVTKDCTSLLKPVEVKDEAKYYELYYFHGRKDTGSIYIATELNMEEYIDEDAFLTALADKNELDSAEVNSITEVNEIDRETYHNMTNK